MQDDPVPRPSTRKSLEQATTAYEKQLSLDDEALSYIRDRGILKEAQDYFRIGVVREPEEGHEFYRGRISFPYITPSGVVAIRFRTIGPPKGKQSKFLEITGAIPRLYNTRALTGAKEVFICEGETDTIAVYGAGMPGVGVPGAHTWAPNSRVYARVFANRGVAVLADNDDTGAGMEFAQSVHASLSGCRIILMPSGHDVSSFIQEEGLDAFRKYITPRQG